MSNYGPIATPKLIHVEAGHIELKVDSVFGPAPPKPQKVVTLQVRTLGDRALHKVCVLFEPETELDRIIRRIYLTPFPVCEQ